MSNRQSRFLSRELRIIIKSIMLGGCFFSTDVIWFWAAMEKMFTRVQEIALSPNVQGTEDVLLHRWLSNWLERALIHQRHVRRLPITYHIHSVWKITAGQADEGSLPNKRKGLLFFFMLSIQARILIDHAARLTFSRVSKFIHLTIFKWYKRMQYFL